MLAYPFLGIPAQPVAQPQHQLVVLLVQVVGDRCFDQNVGVRVPHFEAAEKVLLKSLPELGKYDFYLGGPDLDLTAVVIRFLLILGAKIVCLDILIYLDVFILIRPIGSGEIHVELAWRCPRGIRVEDAAKGLDEVASPCPGLADYQDVMFWS